VAGPPRSPPQVVSPPASAAGSARGSAADSQRSALQASAGNDQLASPIWRDLSGVCRDLSGVAVVSPRPAVIPQEHPVGLAGDVASPAMSAASGSRSPAQGLNASQERSIGISGASPTATAAAAVAETAAVDDELAKSASDSYPEDEFCDYDDDDFDEASEADSQASSADGKAGESACSSSAKSSGSAKSAGSCAKSAGSSVRSAVSEIPSVHDSDED